MSDERQPAVNKRSDLVGLLQQTSSEGCARQRSPITSMQRAVQNTGNTALRDARARAGPAAIVMMCWGFECVCQ